MDDTRLVYSTGSGRICPTCSKPVSACRCRKRPSVEGGIGSADNCLRIHLEKKGRRGKTVTTITGLPNEAEQPKNLAASLKAHCGTGGSVKDGIIVIQGDHRTKIKNELEHLGYRIKLVGG